MQLHKLDKGKIPPATISPLVNKSTNESNTKKRELNIDQFAIKNASFVPSPSNVEEYQERIAMPYQLSNDYSTNSEHTKCSRVLKNAEAYFLSSIDTREKEEAVPTQVIVEQIEGFEGKINFWMKRPARRQADPAETAKYSHLEGQNEYNIWYGKYLTDRYNKPYNMDREQAYFKCNPENDVGYTHADSSPQKSVQLFCAFFAKGCCTKGRNCTYRHSIPTESDEGMIDWSMDVFGRTRFGYHRDDMTGVGSFNHECKTLFVGGLMIDKCEEDSLKKLEEFLWKEFGQWGEVTEIRIIPKKLIAFISYKYRVQCEFAKIAMSDQNIGKYGPILNVKWAHQENQSKKRRIENGLAIIKGSGTNENIYVNQNIKYEGIAQDITKLNFNDALQQYTEAWNQYNNYIQEMHTQNYVDPTIPNPAFKVYPIKNATYIHNDGHIYSDDQAEQKLKQILQRIDQMNENSFQ